jgi:hypothetical protein
MLSQEKRRDNAKSLCDVDGTDVRVHGGTVEGLLELRFGLRLSTHRAGPRLEPSDRLDGLGTQLLQQRADRSKAKGRPC